MKQTISVIMALLLLLISAGYTSGPKLGGAGDATGSPKSTGTCARCHTGGTGTTISSLEITSTKTGTPVTTYHPDSSYTITIAGSSPTNDFFGFQVTAINDSGNYVGGFHNIPVTYAQGEPFGAPEFVEHNTRIPKDTADSFSISFDWSPKAPLGNITLYAMVNAVDGNVKDNFDEPGMPMQIMLTGPLSVEDKKNYSAPFRAYPNPFDTELHISFPSAQAYDIMIHDISGTVLYKTNNNKPDIHINTSDWPKGLYVIRSTKSSNKFSLVCIRNTH